MPTFTTGQLTTGGRRGKVVPTTTKGNDMASPTLFVVKAGWKTYSFVVPDQAEDFYATEYGLLEVSKGRGADKQVLKIFKKWDDVTVTWDDGAVV